jgi:hypothetical protein
MIRQYQYTPESPNDVFLLFDVLGMEEFEEVIDPIVEEGDPAKSDDN